MEERIGKGGKYSSDMGMELGDGEEGRGIEGEGKGKGG